MKLRDIFTVRNNFWSVFFYHRRDKKWYGIPQSGRYWYADPILKKWNGKKYLFMEAFDVLWSVGRIAVSEWNGSRFSTPKVIMKKPYHLSYPFVFEYESNLYMIPETGQNKTLELYQAENHTVLKWKKIKVLRDDIRYADATVILNQGAYYIIAYEEGKSEWKTHVFLLDMRKLEAERLETIVHHENKYRPAGRVFEKEGELYRPVQIGTERYGEGIIIERIDSVTPFKTTAVKEIRTDDLHINIAEGSALGTHTLVVDDEFYAVDMLLSGTNFFAVWVIVLRKARNIIFKLLKR